MTLPSEYPKTTSTIRNESLVNKSQELSDDRAPSNPTLDEKHVVSKDHKNDHEWEYLTYDTVLPEFIVSSHHASAPSPPNLKKYDSPFGWSSTWKNTCLALSCFATFLAASSAGSYSFAAGPLRERWNLSAVAYNTGVTTWAMGFAVSPMFLAPFSEINGRRPILIASGLVFLVSDIGCAVTDSFAGMLVARFFTGAGASSFSTMIGGVISDVYHAEHRNTPMAIYSGFAIGGTGFGPLYAAIVVERTSWTWIFWSHVIALGVLMASIFVLFKETRGSVLLSRKANEINRYYDKLDEYTRQNQSELGLPSQNVRYKVSSDAHRATISRMLYLSLTTPFKFLATEPVVFFFSLWAAFAWGILYMCFEVIPLAYQTNHNFNITQQGAVFTPVVVGAMIGTILSVYQNTLIALTPFARHNKSKSKQSPSPSSSSSQQETDDPPPKITTPHNPESRLYLPCLISPLLPLGLFWFGWTCISPTVPWIVPSIALSVATIGIFTVYLAVFNYLADTYHRYASSALAGQSFCRNVLAAVFPLFTDQMFRRLGFGGAGSLLGGVGLVLTMVPWVLVWKGREIRARSKVASEILGEK